MFHDSVSCTCAAPTTISRGASRPSLVQNEEVPVVARSEIAGTGGLLLLLLLPLPGRSRRMARPADASPIVASPIPARRATRARALLGTSRAVSARRRATMNGRESSVLSVRPRPYIALVLMALRGG